MSEFQQMSKTKIIIYSINMHNLTKTYSWNIKVLKMTFTRQQFFVQYFKIYDP